ncbi:MAG: 2Fe-2S iron-sulfur cluster binding domain-containing protein [Chloroflexi bacterium]|nr:MAG: 2Fe-2S iron-sulfur cluster binding domain-containing protein [Chloroflexota bacterium]
MTAAPPPGDGQVGLVIDGREVRVPKGTLLLDAASEVGIHIPIYCAHPKMDPVAVCRMCLVQVEKLPKLQPACATVVSEGMVVDTQSDATAKAREGMLEFLLLNHPLDCPVCDRGGECDLQDFAFRYGPDTSRFPITEKVHFDKAVPLSDKIELDQERCILCWRCVRYYDEITGEKEIVLQQRGVHTAVATFDGQPLRSDYQGNLPEICPVGALTHRQYRFKARPWDLIRTKGVCPECSYGCNVFVDSRDFEVKRFASRDNPMVDDMWLCDRGRYSATSWNSTSRLRRPLVRDAAGGVRDVGVADAVKEAARRLLAVSERGGGEVIGVLGSPDCTNEEAWLLQRLAREVLRTPHIDHQLAEMLRLGPAEHALGIAEIESCTAVVVLGPEPEVNAPVLTLRLHKAATKRGVAVHRVAANAEPRDITARVGDARLVGVVADETNRARAAAVASALAGGGTAVKRMTVTRGGNGRGVKDMGLLPDLAPGYRPAVPAGMGGRAILESATSGSIQALLLLHAGGVLAGLGALVESALRIAKVVVVIDTKPGVLADAATVLIPGHSLMEKQGSVTNLEGRVQRIRAALPPATSVPSELRVLSMLAGALGAEGWGSGDLMEVHRALAADVPAYAAAGNGGRARWEVAAA